MSCGLSSTLVSALATVAAGLGCRAEVAKISRCSTPLAEMSDALSKAHFQRFWAVSRSAGLSLPLDPVPVPAELLRWVQDPQVDWDLGDRLLRAVLKRSSSAV